MSSGLTLLVLSTIPSGRAADYTGDGIDDLLVGIPQQSFPGFAYPGAVELIRGSSAGLTSNRDLMMHQDTTAVAGVNAEFDLFGWSLAAGDVDGDGKDDIIVGGPNETVDSVSGGAIWRIEVATSAATTVTTSQMFSQATAGVTGTIEELDYFGQALTVADFDDDGYDDVVVGIPGEGVGSADSAGAIEYLRGSSTGLTTSGQKEYDQDVASVAGGAEAFDDFGSALAAGDFDGDDYADLAIGVPGEDWTGTDEGAVHVMYGSASGPNVVSPDDELWTSGEGGAAGTLGDDSACGTALAVGDLDGDGYADLAVGCPGDASPGGAESGSVLLLYGGSSGLDDSESWSQDTWDVGGTAESGDHFGAVLTSGDYDGDDYDDLAIASPEEDYVGFVDNGVVQILPGSSTGVTGSRDVLLSEETAGVKGTSVDNEHWASSLASGDYDDDGLDDLAVGSPYQEVVNVFYGSSTGPSVTGDQTWSQDSPGIDDSTGFYEVFGWSLR